MDQTIIAHVTSLLEAIDFSEENGRIVAITLGEGAVEVLLLALVFPGKAFLPPDIGPAFSASGLRGSLFEREPLALGVGADWIFDFKQAADVVEMRLRSGALLEIYIAPFGQELVWSHVAAIARE